MIAFYCQNSKCFCCGVWCVEVCDVRTHCSLNDHEIAVAERRISLIDRESLTACCAEMPELQSWQEDLEQKSAIIFFSTPGSPQVDSRGKKSLLSVRNHCSAFALLCIAFVYPSTGASSCRKTFCSSIGLYCPFFTAMIGVGANSGRAR